MTESEAAGAALKALGVKQLLPPPSLGKAAAGTGTGRPRSAVSSVVKLQELVPKVCCCMLPQRGFPSYAAAYCRQGGAQRGLLHTATALCPRLHTVAVFSGSSSALQIVCAPARCSVSLTRCT